jgi:hypothetical protein
MTSDDRLPSRLKKGDVFTIPTVYLVNPAPPRVRFQHVYLTLRVWCTACDVDLPTEWRDDVVPCPICRRVSTMQTHVRGIKLLWLRAI